MTVTTEDELEGLKAIGRIVAQVLAAMSAAAEPGMTTRELDDMVRARNFLQVSGRHLHQHQ